MVPVAKIVVEIQPLCVSWQSLSQLTAVF